MAAEDGPPAALAQEHKFSRYRSVRKAQQQHSAPAPAVPEVATPPESAAMARSMSRYHRKRPQTATGTADRPPAIPAHPATKEPTPTVPSSNPQQSARARTASSPKSPQNLKQPQLPVLPESDAQMTSARRRDASGEKRLKPKPYERPEKAREEARRILSDEAERQERMRAAQVAEKKARLEKEEAERSYKKRRAEEAALKTESLLKEQREKQEREQQQRQEEETETRAAEQQEDGERARRHRLRRESRGKSDHSRKKSNSGIERDKPSTPTSPSEKKGFGLFKRRKPEHTPPTPPSPPERKVSAPISPEKGEAVIRPGGGGIVPGTDAPISAVNAGDRRVLVTCGKSSMLLPVTPTTTPTDLIKSASICFSEPIKPQESVLAEDFGKVGIQRYLRKYEHVRDVMNSWDHDKQHALILTSATQYELFDLSIGSVPEKEPTGRSWYLYYSQKPGKWDKRYITLSHDGQVKLSKNDTGKDSANVCHLSDFDIYTPESKQKYKKLRPPKKYCFAIKSNQKSTMFLTTVNYVHFFCTNDKRTGDDFYRAVQGWRSWYLVNIMGEHDKTSKPVEQSPAHAPPNQRELPRSSPARGKSVHRQHASQGSIGSQYQLGSFKPLMDLSNFTYGGNQQPQKIKPVDDDNIPLGTLPNSTEVLHARKMSQRSSSKTSPPIAYRPVEPEVPDTSDAFSRNGLLGRTYSQRQKAVTDRDAAEKSKAAQGPFTEGPSLISMRRRSLDSVQGIQPSGTGAGFQRGTSIRSSGGHHRRSSSDMQRNNSIKTKPKPLIDLTPQYKEPPQFQKKGKGYKPEPGGAGRLIDCATSPDVAIVIPPANDWRSGRNAPAAGPANVVSRSKSLRGHGVRVSNNGIAVGGGEGLSHLAVNNHDAVPSSSKDAFTGAGLLGGLNKFSQGNVGMGRGVLDGSKARGPMLDMSEESRFQQGSLLRQVEARKGAGGLLIDRERD